LSQAGEALRLALQQLLLAEDISIDWRAVIFNALSRRPGKVALSWD
jgi:hypothetical protein